jgi:hypothetical protein
MLFITTQPDNDYYVWQLQVQLNNFKKFGLEDKCIIIFGYNPIIGKNPNAEEFEKNTSAKILFYPDKRDLSTRLYLPSIRPHLLKQLYKNDFEIVENKNYLYLDCDMIFSNYPDFSKIVDEKYVHLSDMSTHFSFGEIKSNKSLYENMCKTVGISPTIVNKNVKYSGGFSYVFKYFHYFDYDFWEKVETDSTILYKMMLVTNSKDNFTQIMAANNWAMLWNLWLIGYDTRITQELAQSWATNPIADWGKYNLFNNAGVIEKDKKTMFYKGDFFEKTPFNHDFSKISADYCSIKYVDEIIETSHALKREN